MEVYNNINNKGGINYLDDVMQLSTTAGATASSVFAADSRFTVTCQGSSSISSYFIQVTNCNPFVTINPYNQNVSNPQPKRILNPNFEGSWTNLSSISASNWYYGAAPFRFVRIINSGGFESNVKFYVYADKFVPIIV
jgi:hypothetical protein